MSGGPRIWEVKEICVVIWQKLFTELFNYGTQNKHTCLSDVWTNLKMKIETNKILAFLFSKKRTIVL